MNCAALLPFNLIRGALSPKCAGAGGGNDLGDGSPLFEVGPDGGGVNISTPIGGGDEEPPVFPSVEGGGDGVDAGGDADELSFVSVGGGGEGKNDGIGGEGDEDATGGGGGGDAAATAGGGGPSFTSDVTRTIRVLVAAALPSRSDTSYETI